MTWVIPSDTVVIVPLTVSPTFVTMLLISSELLEITATRFPAASITIVIPAQANATPPPMASRDTPKATMPTAPAVIAGPHADATYIRAPIPTAIPANTAMAGPPASVIRMAESTNTEIAWAAIYNAAAAATIFKACPAMLPKEAPAASTGAAAVEAAPPSPPMLPISPPIPLVNVEIPPTIFPPMANNGPATAAMPAILIMVSCISGDRPFQASAAFSAPSARLPMISTIIGPADSTRSDPRSFSSFRVVVKSSMGSLVSSNVVDTESPQSVTEFESSSKDRRPSRTAAAIAGPALFPKSSMAAWAASVSEPAPTIFFWISPRASPSGLPSLVAFCNAFFIPVMTAELSTPDFCRFARKPVAVLNPKPISCRAVPFESSADAS